jgi:hypothetical protein
MFPNNEIFIYDTAVIKSFFALNVNIGIIQKRIIIFDANFINVFFELIVNQERVRKKIFFYSKSIFLIL